MNLEVKSQASVHLRPSAFERLQLADGSRSAISARPRFRSTSEFRPNARRSSRIRCYSDLTSGQWPNDGGEAFPVHRPRRDHAGLGPSLQLTKEEAVEMQLKVRA